MNIFSLLLLSKNFHFNNHAEHFINDESGALEKLLFRSHEKALLENIAV